MNKELEEFVNSVKKKSEITSVIELGPGSFEDSFFLSSALGANVVAIDKQILSVPGGPIRAVVGDYFDHNIISALNIDSIDLLVACYTLCFNTKQSLSIGLRQYLKMVRPEGYVYILDFSSKEAVVTRRTNLDDAWFDQLIVGSGFDLREKKTRRVFEPAHNHTHETVELIYKKHLS